MTSTYSIDQLIINSPFDRVHPITSSSTQQTLLSGTVFFSSCRGSNAVENRA
ncbi:MAG TPA: hypothetical protein VMV69_24520 [Pirellulales bacterium]|nr:hypothetical protein [Pirellulales bacterium]